MQTEFKHFTVGTPVFCDFFVSGKPRGKVVEIIRPGNGRDNNGEVRVKLAETVGAYRKGEILTVDTFTAVPLKMKLPLRRGEFFTRVSTLYAYA